MDRIDKKMRQEGLNYLQSLDDLEFEYNAVYHSSQQYMKTAAILTMLSEPVF